MADICCRCELLHGQAVGEEVEIAVLQRVDQETAEEGRQQKWAGDC